MHIYCYHIATWSMDQSDASIGLDGVVFKENLVDPAAGRVHPACLYSRANVRKLVSNFLHLPREVSNL